jgi:hypothetical protein
MGLRRRPLARAFAAFAFVIALLAIAANADGAGTQATVGVTIRRASCGVSPRAVAAGKVAFRVANRSGRSAAFVVVSARVRVPAGRVRTFTVSLKAGAAAYSCAVSGRRIASGTLRVSAPPQPAVKHRIGIRNRNGFGEFYDRLKGASFVPRGGNYIRLAPQVDTFGRRQVYHSTFIVGEYQATRAEAALARMAASGYTVVRVFLSNTCAGDAARI